MEKIQVMISSTVKDLISERDAVKKAFKDLPFVELVGADPLNEAALAGNSRTVTTGMARSCDLYILILGSRFGFDIGNGKSATEIEFDAAIRDDPTKILVFKKETQEEPEDKQRAFINKVSSYYNGYWRTSFIHTHDLQTFVKNAFSKWIKERASIGTGLTYLDHFVRLAKQVPPEPHAQVYYKVTKKDVELEYEIFNRSHEIHFTREEIYRNFWGCFNELSNQFDRWIEEGDGGH
ncbi:DUF4062 domain-containing protein [Rossellomorea aquimaris]|uniref:DUF4062 domain-containing protein n=1 Tax=Rossellomorea aquimaris TaxID=189382 RepID=UPI001CD209E1|nr:DUF4062 domain-containing protein [Rossellomorea aquimaris]MCA1057800.1 DUF4062 domain-containing protein [Rossellomorea aquimaris]